MPEKIKDTRPWYKIRRVQGGLMGTVGMAILLIPGAPVIVTIGAVAITTPFIGTLLTGVATYIFGYGQGSKVEREKK